MIPFNHLIPCHPLLLLPSVSPASGSFPVSQLFSSGDQSIGVSASASVLPMNIQGWFPLGLSGFVFWLSKGLSRVLQHHNLKASVLQHSAFFMVYLWYPYMTTGKTIVLTIQTLVGKVMPLLCNTLSRLGKVKCRPANCGSEHYNKELKNLQARDFLFCFVLQLITLTWLADLLMPVQSA